MRKPHAGNAPDGAAGAPGDTMSNSAPRPEDSAAKSRPRSSPPRPFRDTALASGLVTAAQVEAAEAELRAQAGAGQGSANGQGGESASDRALADLLVAQGAITPFQAEQMLVGRRKLTLGQYKILDAIGQGGMGRVFKAEHVMMGREVAIKVLPREKSTPG